MWAPSPSDSRTQGETLKTFRGERAGSDLSRARRCRQPERPGGGAPEGSGRDEVRALGKVNGDATKYVGASTRDLQTAQVGSRTLDLFTRC